MKKIALILILAMLLSGCQAVPAAQVAATTLPVYAFTSRLCQGAGITVTRLVTEPVSCLHDYSLGVAQLRTLEQAELVVISGVGLEDFLPLEAADKVLDASQGIELLLGPDGEPDPHIWLSPACARQMAQNICDGLCARYPAQKSVFRENLAALLSDLIALEDYGREALAPLAQKGLLPFHDGFSYFARDFGLNVPGSPADPAVRHCGGGKPPCDLRGSERQHRGGGNHFPGNGRTYFFPGHGHGRGQLL